MADALIIWDDRDNNEDLKSFIDEFALELSRYSLSSRMVSLSYNTDGAGDQIKPSMRALMDLVYQESPLHLITFGSKPNSLAALISPALRCQLHTNRLPEWLESGQVPSAIARIASYIHKDDTWGSGKELSDYFYPHSYSKATSNVLCIEEDLLSEEVMSHASMAGVALQKLPLKAFLPPSRLQLEECGLLVVSADLVTKSNLIEVANGYGVPVLLISPDNRNFGIRDGENGWVVNNTQQIHYTNYLINWQSMSQNTREMVSRYCRTIQSNQSGLRCYCSSLGYPERLELKDFKLRG
ncbi:hypothetical protein MAQ5080_00906 [Marinomonas aquimarina]|uniref:Uncharacterized protein n=1 Tax=Marinomonas aquimarina TaxID=295068 RepID=A0A1A8T5R2_9GAMM|nr:hypothetical protein [Marinomonas aquimarina]SBS27720.1 hypothetical protein MAQ5080_00906 [Marinomonas aquimarina]